MRVAASVWGFGRAGGDGRRRQGVYCRTGEGGLAGKIWEERRAASGVLRQGRCEELSIAAKLFAHVGAEQRRTLVDWLTLCGPEAATKGNFMQPVQTVAGKSKRLPLPMFFKCLDLSPPDLGLQSQRRGANATVVQVPPFIEKGAGGPAP